MPSLAILLFVATGATVVKVFYWDKFMKRAEAAKPAPAEEAEDAAKPKSSILDADVLTIDVLSTSRDRVKTYTFRVQSDSDAGGSPDGMRRAGESDSEAPRSLPSDVDTVLDLKALVEQRRARESSRSERVIPKGARSSEKRPEVPH